MRFQQGEYPWVTEAQCMAHSRHLEMLANCWICKHRHGGFPSSGGRKPPAMSNGRWSPLWLTVFMLLIMPSKQRNLPLKMKTKMPLSGLNTLGTYSINIPWNFISITELQLFPPGQISPKKQWPFDTLQPSVSWVLENKAKCNVY